MSDPLVQEAHRRNWDVWAVDLRGIGELAPDKPSWVSAVSLLLGEDFGWRQGWELSRILAFPGKLRAIYARGPNSSLAALYALSMPNVRDPEWVVLHGQPVSFDPLPEIASIPFGVLRATGVSELLQPSKPKRFTVDEILKADW